MHVEQGTVLVFGQHRGEGPGHIQGAEQIGFEINSDALDINVENARTGDQPGVVHHDRDIRRRKHSPSD